MKSYVSYMKSYGFLIPQLLLVPLHIESYMPGPLFTISIFGILISIYRFNFR